MSIPVGLSKPEDGNVLTGPVYVTLDRIDIRYMEARDPGLQPNLETLLDLSFNGASRSTSTLVGCWKPAKKPFAQTFGQGRLLYAGAGKGLLACHAQFIESDQDQRDLLKKIADLFDWGQKHAHRIPAYGALIGSGAGLLSSVFSLAAATVADDHEFSFYGTLDDLSGKGGLREGAYTLWKARDATQPDIAVQFSVHPLPLPSRGKPIGAKETVVVLLEDLDLRPLHEAGLDGSDFIQVEALCGEKKVQRLEFKQAFQMHRQKIAHRARFCDALLYRGPYGSGVPLSLSVKAVPKDLSKEINHVINKTEAFAAALCPDHEDRVKKLAEFGLELSSALAAANKGDKPAGLLKSLVVDVGTPKVAAGHQAGALIPAGLSSGQWTRHEIPLSLGKGLKTKLRLRIKKL